MREQTAAQRAVEVGATAPAGNPRRADPVRPIYGGSDSEEAR